MAKNSNRLFHEFNEYREEHSLARELPYWEFIDDLVVLSDGSICQGLTIHGVSIETWDAERVNRLTEGLRAFLNGLPDGIELSYVAEKNSDLNKTIAAHGGFTSDRPEVQWVSQARLQVLAQELKIEALSKITLKLFVYRRIGVGQSSSGLGGISAFFKSPKSFQTLREEEFSQMKTELRQVTHSIQESLESLGVASELMTGADVWEVVYQFLNPNRMKAVPPPKLARIYQEQEFTNEEQNIVPELSLPSPREQLAFSDVIQGVEAFVLDGNYHRTLTLKTLPEATHSALIAKIMQLPFQFWLDVHIKVPDQSNELSDLQAKRRMAHSMSLSQGGRATDLESEARLNSTEELLRELINTGQKIFYFQTTLLLRSPSQSELERMTKSALNKFRELNGAEGLAESVAGFKVFKTLMPAGNVATVRAKRVKTDNLADFLPIYEPYTGRGVSPVCLFKNRQTGLVAYDPFDERLPNYNGLVTGSSGAGKSFVNNLILLQFMTQNPVVFIIDIGGSYKKLCEFMGGQYIEINPPSEGEKRKVINPFVLPMGEKEPSSQKIKFLLALLENIFTESDEEKLPKLEKSLLEEAIIETYKNRARKGSEPPKLSDLRDHLANCKEGLLQNFAKMLYPWTGDRAYGKLLDRDNELELDSDFVVFDLKGLSNYPDLQAVMILIITDFIMEKIEAKRFSGRRKRILMDEVWQLLKNRASANAMEYWVRTLRKSGSGVTFVTQGLEEIAAHPISSAILGNTATKLILMQKGDLEISKRILKLNDQEMSLITTLKRQKGQYSEAFLIAGEDRTVIRATPTPIEYWLATSDDIDNHWVEEVRSRFPGKTLSEVIHWLAERFPLGSQGKRNIPESAWHLTDAADSRRELS